VLDEIIPSYNESRSFVFNRIAWSMKVFKRLVEARRSSVTLPEALGRMRVHPQTQWYKRRDLGSERTFRVETLCFVPGFSSLSDNGDKYK
jgi:hypothetical protein